MRAIYSIPNIYCFQLSFSQNNQAYISVTITFNYNQTNDTVPVSAEPTQLTTGSTPLTTVGTDYRIREQYKGYWRVRESSATRPGSTERAVQLDPAVQSEQCNSTRQCRESSATRPGRAERAVQLDPAVQSEQCNSTRQSRESSATRPGSAERAVQLDSAVQIDLFFYYSSVIISIILCYCIVDITFC